MKPGSIVLAFASSLLLAPLANAGQISTPADSANAELAAIFAAPDSPDCAGAKLPFPELTPAPAEKAVVCAGCSDTICQGKQSGQYCKFSGGKYYYCQLAIYRCSPWDCQCWTGPLP